MKRRTIAELESALTAATAKADRLRQQAEQADQRNWATFGDDLAVASGIRRKPNARADAIRYDAYTPRGGTVSRPRILDLFCGAGGAAMGYSRAGFDVVGVDINPQPNYPFEFHQLDATAVRPDVFHECWHESSALTALGGRSTACLGRFDAIHASPPCQRYSTITGDGRDKHPDLVAPIRELLEESGLPWVIENVPQAPLVDPVILCGSAFGLRVRRHRAFESNVPIAGTACHHGEQGRPVGVYGQHPDKRQHLRPDGTERGTKATSLGHGRRAMGIDWMEWPELAESIPPAFTEWVGRQLLSALSTGASTRPGSSRAHTLGNAASLDRKTGFPLNMGALADSAPCVRSPRSGCAGIGACSLESSRVQDDPA